jgi:hypothetical protein
MKEKSASVQMYMTPSEKRSIRIAAAKQNTTMAEYCRDVVISHLVEEGELQDDG